MSEDLDSGTLRLDIVGAGPAYTNRPGATGAAYLVRHGTTALLMDLGQGAFPRLAGLLDPADITAILISHLHPDHFIDLVPLRHYLRWGKRGTRRVRVIAPTGLATRLDALHADAGFTAAALDVESMPLTDLRVGPLSVELCPVTHDGASYAFRLCRTNRPGLVYTGDCGRAEDVDALIRPGDVLLSEVSFGPGPVPTDAAHLDGPSVGALAARTGVSRVLLTHLLMDYDEAQTVAAVQRAFPGPVAFVQPGDHYAIEG